MDVHGFKFTNEVSITNVQDDDDEVIYLYRASTQDRVVELIDITENRNSSRDRQTGSLYITSESQSNSRRIPVQRNPVSAISKISIKPLYKGVSQTVANPVKRVQKKRKRPADIPRCIVCEDNYEIVGNKKGGLHSNKCGHLYCLPCIRSLKDGNCVQCNRAISNLLKIYV